ncbi:unnamed protein product, partial [Protopolystoma xenopodis]
MLVQVDLLNSSPSAVYGSDQIKATGSSRHQPLGNEAQRGSAEANEQVSSLPKLTSGTRLKSEVGGGDGAEAGIEAEGVTSSNNNSATSAAASTSKATATATAKAIHSTAVATNTSNSPAHPKPSKLGK